MPPFRKTDALDALQQIAGRLRLCMETLDRASVATEPYSPLREADYADEVDRLCAQLVQEWSQRAGVESMEVAPVRMKAGLAELVLCRVQDAQRHLQHGTAPWAPQAKPETALRRLLVEWWHSYAEPYWLERLERAKGAANGSVQKAKAKADELMAAISRYFDVTDCGEEELLVGRR